MLSGERRGHTFELVGLRTLGKLAYGQLPLKEQLRAFRTKTVKQVIKERSMATEYKGNYHCPNCKRVTRHTVHSEGHERDSYYDYRQCDTCDAIKHDHNDYYVVYVKGKRLQLPV